MKKSIIKIGSLFALIILLVMAMSSCDKAYNNASFGYNYIYMPQATVSGGLNLNYPVPAGLDTATYNYQLDTVNHKLNVYLGVAASGEKAGLGYTVNVSANIDTTNQIITGGTIPNAILLPDSIYTLPSSVTVLAGKSSGSFFLTINSTDLLQFAGKTAVLTVQLSSPTNYQLNTQLNKVVVVINVSKLNLH
jgi:hypothetical protein